MYAETVSPGGQRYSLTSDCDNCGADVQLVVADLLDRAQQFVEGAVARQVALGAGVDGRAHVGRGIGGGDADRLAARAALQQPAGGLDAVETRQHHVHQHDIRLPSGHQLHALQSVDRMADHVDVRRIVQQGHHALQHDAAFGGNHDTCVHSLPVLAMELPTRDRAATRVPCSATRPFSIDATALNLRLRYVLSLSRCAMAAIGFRLIWASRTAEIVRIAAFV